MADEPSAIEAEAQRVLYIPNGVKHAARGKSRKPGADTNSPQR